MRRSRGADGTAGGCSAAGRRTRRISTGPPAGCRLDRGPRSLRRGGLVHVSAQLMAGTGAAGMGSGFGQPLLVPRAIASASHCLAVDSASHCLSLVPSGLVQGPGMKGLRGAPAERVEHGRPRWAASAAAAQSAVCRRALSGPGICHDRSVTSVATLPPCSPADVGQSGPGRRGAGCETALCGQTVMHGCLWTRIDRVRKARPESPPALQHRSCDADVGPQQGPPSCTGPSWAAWRSR